ncbi:MAG: 4Fe-4S binding protein [Nitrososphaerota archaeon]
MKKTNIKNIVQSTRHISQAIFFILFMLLVVGSTCSFSVSWLRFIEPLGGLQALLSNLTNINLKITLVILSGVTGFILITIFLGRAWCGWACPVGFLVELGEYIFTKTKIKKYGSENIHQEKFLNNISRHAVLGGVLASSLISRNPVWCEVCPVGTICRTTSAGGFIAVAETTIIGGVVSSSLYRKRFFCKYVCPISSLLAIISKLNFFIKPVVNKKLCRECTLCEMVCPEGIPLYKEEELSKCTKCLECYSKCPHDSVSIKVTGSVKSSKKNMTVLTLTIILLAMVIHFSYVYTAPVETTLNIHPENSTITPGETITIIAKLSSHTEPIYNKEIYWWSSEGFFNSSIGHAVRFTAPQSNENKTIEIRANFYGDETYLSSNASTTIQLVYMKKEPTTILIEPFTFMIKSSENITLKVLTSPLDLPGELIKWKLVGLGRLSNASGRTVTYYPPEEIQEEIRVNITAVFEGDVRHLPSISCASGLIVPKHLEMKSTILMVSPSSFTVRQGENITLRVVLRTVDGEEVEGVIKWRLKGPGKLSNTIGREIKYYAPKGINETYIEITAYFEGDGRHLPYETTVTGLIIGEKLIFQEVFEAKFDKMTFEDIVSMEDVTIGNLTTTFLKARRAVAENIEITNLGLTSRIAVLNDTEAYLTYLIGEVGRAPVDLEGFKNRVGQKNITVENGVIMFMKLTCREAEFYDLLIIGEYVGGEEPYIPLVITGREVMLSGGYYLDTPKTYRELINKVLELTSGRIEVRNFSLVKPMNYHLDKELKKYQYSRKLLLNSSRIIGEDMTTFSIYYKVVFRVSRYMWNLKEFTVEATGETDIRKVVFHFWIGFEIGRICHLITSTEVHIVYFKLDKCLMENLIFTP